MSAWGKCHEDLWVHVLHWPLGRCSPKELHYLPARLNEAPHTWWMEGPSTNLSVNLQGTQYGYMAVKYQWFSNLLIFRLIFRQKSTGFRMFDWFSTEIDSLDSLPKQPKKVAKPPHIWAKLGQMRNSGKKNKIIQNLSIKRQNMFSTSQPYLGRIWGVFVGPLQSRFICFIYFMDSQRSIPGADVHTCLTCAKEMAFNQLWWYIWWKIPSSPKLPPEPSNVPYEECWDFGDHTNFDSLMQSWFQIWAMDSNGTHVEFVV